MKKKITQILSMIMALVMMIPLSACHKEEVDPNRDPLLDLSAEELVQMIYDYEADLNNQIEQTNELQAALDARGDTEKVGGITEMSDGTKRMTFNTVDDIITLPVPWCYPNSKIAPNTSSINISDIVKIETDSTWTMYFNGSSLLLNHVDGISGNITIGTIDDSVNKLKPDELQAYIQDTLFADFPIENPSYSPLYVADRQRGIGVLGGTRIDEQEARISCGIIEYNTTSVQYFFVYTGEQRRTYDEAIRALLSTMTIRSNKLAI